MVSEGLLADVAAAAPYIIRRLGYLVGKREEILIIEGDPATDNVGLLQATNGVESFTSEGLGGDDLFAGIVRTALQAYEVSGLDPTPER